MIPLERVVSPTPSAKKALSALQRVKQLGGKFKKSRNLDDVPDTFEEPSAAEAEQEELHSEYFDAAFEQLGAVPESPEPASLAERIRTLISVLPIPSRPPPVKTDPPPVDADGRPVLPKTVVKDLKFIALLSDPDVMNGHVDDGRPSVWAALEALSPPEQKKPAGDVPGKSDGKHEEDGLTDVMLYAPLHPTNESEVELAHTRDVEVSGTSKADSRWDILWSYTVRLLKSQPHAKSKVIKAWVPSATKISFQAMWWGYRIYLPPPVMASLNSDEAEAAKIATTITAVLTWFLSHVNVSMVPIPLQPAFLLLQTLGPYVGYIGTFIAWIWGSVRHSDKGNGVVLTATWVLPVALIPSAIKTPVPATSTSTPALPTSTPAAAGTAS